MRLLRDRYDTSYFNSPAYQGRPNSQRNRLRLREILAHKTGGRLLEIGCGRGEFLVLAATKFDVEGLEASEFAVMQAHAAVRDRISRGNVEEEGTLNHLYDVIVALNVLEHLRSPARVLVRLMRHLAPGGVLFGSVPHNDQLVGRAHTRVTNFFDRTHRSTFAPVTWRRLFQEAGFRRINFFGEAMLGPQLATYVRSVFWEIVALNLVFVCKR
jgi:2-polyprenyl-3-methyl-5-hydroxy-6-metoxy-1,4-benzoquinol methylase